MAANAIDNIIDKKLNYEDKVVIKNLGAPRPDLTIVQKDKRKDTAYKRHFKKALYTSAKWLCGCNVRNAFFCFVCVLINPDLSDVAWTKKGVTDLKHFGAKVQKHKMSALHLHNELEFAMLGRSNIRTQLDSAYRRSVKEHNELVKKNRYILNKVVDRIKFCGAFELALHGHEETVSGNPRIFKGLINLLAEVDTILKEPLNSNCAFIGLSKTIQNDILDAILHVCREIIKSEIGDSDFLALQADETTDSSNKQQMVLIYRYEYKEQIYERFWGFFSPEDFTADGLSKVVLEQLQLININKKPNKLISQSYDGASVVSSTGGVQTKIKNIYKQAHFIHCYAHQLNLIMEKAVSQNKKVEVFFTNLEAFAEFFSKSAKLTSNLDCFTEKPIPSGSSTGWSIHISTVTTVYKYRDKLIQCFDEIIDKDNDNTAIRKSIALKNTLNDPDFIFWLHIFNKIIPDVDILHNQLQQKLDPLKVKTHVLEFKKNIQTVHDSINVLCDTMLTSANRPKTNMVAKEVCDVVIACAEDRFEFLDHLSLSLLLCPEMFTEYRHCFPENTFQIATRKYSFIDALKLKQELLVLYNRNDFCTLPAALPLLQMFSDNNLLEAFSETVKVLKIICTIPMTTVESERNFSTRKRIKTFLRNTVSQDRLTALAMCSIEKDLIQNTEDFNVRVINHFVHQKEGRADFIYKSYN